MATDGSKLKERQFSWQPTLIEDWGLEEADEARPLETTESPDKSDEPSGNVRKKKLSNQFAFDMVKYSIDKVENNFS